MAMKYKAGDKVKVKEWKDLELEYKVNEDGDIDFDLGFAPEMRAFCGKELVIKKLCDDSYICLGNKWRWQDWMFEEETIIKIGDHNSSVKYDMKLYEVSLIAKDIKIVNTHEDTILNLNELNTSKTRKIERLMKFIANDYSITMDLEKDLIRETLMKELKDEDLVNEIMFHVRKGSK